MAMEVATPVHAPAPSPATNLIVSATTTAVETHKKNRIQVSNTKKPLFFYVNLAKVSAKKKEQSLHFIITKVSWWSSNRFIYESSDCKLIRISLFSCVSNAEVHSTAQRG